MAAALHLFHAKIQSFSRPVRSTCRVAGEDLSSPRRERGPERLDLSNLIVETSNDGLVEQDRRVGIVASQIHVANRFLSDNRPSGAVVSVVR